MVDIVPISIANNLEFDIQNMFNSNGKLTISPDTSYYLESEFNLFRNTRGDLFYFFNKVGLNLDFIADNLESNFFSFLIKLYDNWYENYATDFDKSAIFYKFLIGLEFQFDSWEKEFSNEMIIIDFKLDRRMKFSKNQNKLLDYFNSELFYDRTYEPEFFTLDGSTSTQMKQQKINNLLSFLEKVQIKFDLYKSNLTHTLDEVMYKFSNDVSNENNIQLRNLEEIVADDASIVDSFLDLKNKFKKSIKKDNKLIKKEKKNSIRMFNKSFQTLSSFLPVKDINCFINGDSFELSGEYFNYKISKKNNYPLLQSPSDTHSVHIPYMLDLYTKNNDYLANLCITFNGCPILDQILSVYLMISSGQEKEMLDKCNFYDKTDLYYEDETVKKIVGKRAIKQTDNQWVNIVNSTLNQYEINDNNKAHKIVLLREKYKKYVHNNIFNSIFDNPLYNFIFKRGVCFDEMLDFYSLSRNRPSHLPFNGGGRFSDNSLDSLINFN